MAHMDGFRTMRRMPARLRRKCICCRGRSTHYGLADGCALVSGCAEWVFQWCKDPAEALRIANRKAVRRAQ
jgi:hypothetical protein